MEGLTFADLGSRLGLPPLAAVCAAVTNGYPLNDDRFPEHLLTALAERCGIRLTDAQSSAGRRPAGRAVPPAADDPVPRRRILRILLQRMVQRRAWFPAVSDNHSMVRGLPPNERGVGRDAIEALVRAGWLRANKVSADPALGLATELRAEIEAVIHEARVDNHALLDWLQLPGSRTGRSGPSADLPD